MKWLERRRLVLDAFDFEADHGQLVDDGAERRAGVEMSLSQERVNFIALSPPARVGKSSGRKP